MNIEVDGTLINIEIQFRRDPHYKDRALMNWAKLYGGELRSGDDYGDLKKSITINILNSSIFDCKDYHSHFVVMESNRREILSDKCAIHLFELKKIAKTPNKDNMMELWLQLINAETKEEFEMLQQTNVAPIQRAIHIIYEMSEDEKIQEMARIREKALHDETTALNGTRYERSIEIARNLIKINLSVEQVEKATGLTREEIKAIAVSN